MATLSDSGRAGVEQLIAQFHLKILHAILAVRAPRPLGGGTHRPFRRRDRWFHLPLHDPPPPPAADLLQPPSTAEPLVVDVVLSPSGGAAADGEVVERWTAACEPWPDGPPTSGDGFLVNKAYKRCICVLRSVYAALRLLPAYRIFRLLCSSSTQSYNYEMSYRISSFAAPFSRAEEAAMRTRRFTAVETQLGRLAVSVQYRPSLAEFNLQISSHSPPMLIADYVGSPAADPLRVFPASLTENSGSSFPRAPQRPHSWATPAMWPQQVPVSVPTLEQQSAAAMRKGGLNFEEHKFSPPPPLVPLHASPTPSPPTFGGGYLQARLRGETAPVSIPQVAGGRSPVHRNLSDPNRQFLPPPSPRSTRPDPSTQESPSSESSRSFRKTEGIRATDIYTNLYAALSKGKDSRDESGRFSSVLSSGGSPRLGFSRSSSRSILDDLDDTEYPFAEDDVDTPDFLPGSSDGKDAVDQAGSSSHKSQDAAVGSLVHLLKTARPLRDPGFSYLSSTSMSNEAGASSSVMSRRTSEALEELQSFKQLKESLLSRSRTKPQESLERP